METIQNRLAAFVKHTGLSENQFSIRTGMSNGLLANIIKRGASFTTETLEKIMNTFPELNVEWILNGHGAMVKAGATYTATKKSMRLNEPLSTYAKKKLANTIYMVPETLNVGFSKTEARNFPVFTLPWLITGEYWAFKVTDESMHATVACGDIVVANELKSLDQIKNGDVCVLNTVDGVFINRVFRNQNGTSLTLKTDNETYRPFEVEIAKIKSFYLVVERITRNLQCHAEKELVKVYRQLLAAQGISV